MKFLKHLYDRKLLSEVFVVYKSTLIKELDCESQAQCTLKPVLYGRGRYDCGRQSGHKKNLEHFIPMFITLDEQKNNL